MITSAPTTKGFIALTTVLVMSVLFLSLAVAATYQGVGVIQRQIDNEHAHAATHAAHACAEYALAALTSLLHYGGNETLELLYGTCEIGPIDTNSETPTIEVEGVSEDYVYKLKIELSSVSPNVRVDLYQAVVGFE